MIEYFSDREFGPAARTSEEITPVVWAAIVQTVEGLVKDGSLGQSYPEICSDGNVVCGCDGDAFGATIRAEIGRLEWPLQTSKQRGEGYSAQWEPYAPHRSDVLDLVTLVYAKVAKPITREYHKHFKHNHLAFDTEAGQEGFRETINRYFARNAIAFELEPGGRVVRLLPPVMDMALLRTTFNTGNPELNNLLEDARTKFADPDPLVRREGLERLCDSWERLKSLPGPNKKTSMQQLLNVVTSDPVLHQRLNDEAYVLTEISNSYFLRHHELSQTPVTDIAQVDYFFHRLFAMIQMILRKAGMA